MLSYLRIRGLALASDVALELGPGLTVLTGETGAGKSIIVDALTLLRGARGRAELVRAGDQSAHIDAQFDLTGPSLRRVEGALLANGLPVRDAGALVLQRVVQRSGRGRCLVQGELVPQIVASEVGAGLIDVCSQHEHHSLTAVARHGELLDAYAGLEADVAEYTSAWQALREAERVLADASRQGADTSRRVDLLRHELAEFDALAPEPEEYSSLQPRLALLREAEHWRAFAAEARDTLYDADGSIVDRLARLAQTALPGVERSSRLADLSRELHTARSAVEEAARHADRLAEEVEVDPGELNSTEDRVTALLSLADKHRVPPDTLHAHSQQLAEELQQLLGAEDRVAELSHRVKELSSHAVALASVLSERRRAARSRLTEALQRELAGLFMAHARLEVNIESRPAELGPRGMDRVELTFSANPGEPLAAFGRVASGGELSRVLLALKSVLAEGDGVSTYVFDEVDAGVSGAVAEAIGLRLARASRARQVISVTHLPQIAAFANVHLRVEKVQEGARTVTRVVRLDEDERIEELARLLGGSTVTASARDHARELVRVARARAREGLAEVHELLPAEKKRRAPKPARKKAG